jgi:tRNA nucleotidyltransferase (CCA-adding enzyme)
VSRQLAGPMRDGERLTIDLPGAVRDVLERLASAGFEAALVGGSVRDLVTGTTPLDWDVATAGPPERVEALFPGSSWENRFGTVTVRADGMQVEVTTYRHEGPYLDRRRPQHVRWGSSLRDDLARRDFTVNALAWQPTDLAAGSGVLIDPYDGIGDLQRGVLRAVGEPAERFSEDALRMVRAVRFSTRLELQLDPSTAAAIRERAASASALSGERVRDELLRMLAAAPPAEPPSAAVLLMDRLGLLEVLLPELAALRGVPQAKALAGDALQHSVRTADALPADRPLLRLAGLLHDLGKATTLADGHFIGHEVEGAALADAMLRRLRLPRADAARIARLVRQHMFAYSPEWTDAAVRRFVRRVGVDLLDDLFALRAADNAASGATEPAHGGLDELRRRVGIVVLEGVLHPAQLAVDGRDLIADLGLLPGPLIGELLARLMEAVLDDPALNHRDRLLDLASGWHEAGGAATQRQAADAGDDETADDGPAATIGGPGAVPT